MSKKSTIKTATIQCDCFIQKMKISGLTNEYLIDNSTILQLTTSENINLASSRYFDTTNESDPIWYMIKDKIKAISSSTAERDILTIKNCHISTGQITNSYISNLCEPENNFATFIGLGIKYTNSTLIKDLNQLPQYTSNNMFKVTHNSAYYVEASQKLLFIELAYQINNTDALSISSSNNSKPTIILTITNKVMTLNKISNNVQTYKNTCTINFQSPIVLKSLNNQVPFVFAPGFKNIHLNVSIMYVEPLENNGDFYCQYLSQDAFNVCDDHIDFDNNFITGKKTLYGHFVCGLSFADNGKYYKTHEYGIQEQLMIRETWKSPIRIINNYEKYSTHDITNINITLLFGKDENGGTFLVLNSGTPISLIKYYAITSLSNFIKIIKVYKMENNSIPLTDYFIDLDMINIINGKNIYGVIHPANLSIIDNTNVFESDNLPDFYHIFINKSNAFGLSIDSTSQKAGIELSKKYFGDDNASLMSFGTIRYGINKLSASDDFCNSLLVDDYYYDNVAYYHVIILPESCFNPTTTSKTMDIYSNNNSPFYIEENNSKIYCRMNDEYKISKISLNVDNNEKILK